MILGQNLMPNLDQKRVKIGTPSVPINPQENKHGQAIRSKPPFLRRNGRKSLIF